MNAIRLCWNSLLRVIIQFLKLTLQELIFWMYGFWLAKHYSLMCTQNYDQFIATFFSKHISQPKQESTYAPNHLNQIKGWGMWSALISCFAKITFEQYCHAFCCCFAKTQVKWVILNMQHELKEKETQMGNLTFFNGGMSLLSMWCFCKRNKLVATHCCD